MIEDKTFDEMALFMVRLNKSLEQRGMPLFMITHILAIYAFHQFNGTRNDITHKFNKLIEKLES